MPLHIHSFAYTYALPLIPTHLVIIPHDVYAPFLQYYMCLTHRQFYKLNEIEVF